MRTDSASLMHVVVQSVFLFDVWEKKVLFSLLVTRTYGDWMWKLKKKKCHATRCTDPLVCPSTMWKMKMRLQQQFDFIWHLLFGVILWKRRMLSVPCTKDLIWVLNEMWTFMCLAKWFCHRQMFLFSRSKFIDLFWGSLCVHVCCEFIFFSVGISFFPIVFVCMMVSQHDCSCWTEFVMPRDPVSLFLYIVDDLKYLLSPSVPGWNFNKTENADHIYCLPPFFISWSSKTLTTILVKLKFYSLYSQYSFDDVHSYHKIKAHLFVWD